MLPGKRVRLGIVGCGAIVREAHLPVIAGDPRIDVVMLCDRNRRNALVMQREFGLECRITESIGDLGGEVDAAIVAVPPRLHAPITVQLLEMGIDVLCEKPLANSASDGARMAETARARKRVLAVALMTRFFPHNARLRELVDDGELGELQEIVASDGAPLDWAMTTDSYFNRNTTAGGVLFDSGVHLLDRVLWLFGDLDEIDYEDDSFGGVETNARLRGVVRGEGGRRIPARMEFSWSHRLRRSIQAIGTKGTIEARVQAPRMLTLRRKTQRGTIEMEVPCADAWDATSAYRAQLSDFIEAVRERRTPFVSAESAVKALAVIETAYARRKPMAQPWLERRRGHA